MKALLDEVGSTRYSKRVFRPFSDLPPGFMFDFRTRWWTRWRWEQIESVLERGVGKQRWSGSLRMFCVLWNNRIESLTPRRASRSHFPLTSLQSTNHSHHWYTGRRWSSKSRRRDNGVPQSGCSGGKGSTSRLGTADIGRIASR